MERSVARPGNWNCLSSPPEQHEVARIGHQHQSIAADPVAALEKAIDVVLHCCEVSSASPMNFPFQGVITGGLHLDQLLCLALRRRDGGEPLMRSFPKRLFAIRPFKPVASPFRAPGVRGLRAALLHLLCRIIRRPKSGWPAPENEIGISMPPVENDVPMARAADAEHLRLAPPAGATIRNFPVGL